MAASVSLVIIYLNIYTNLPTIKNKNHLRRGSIPLKRLRLRAKSYNGRSEALLLNYNTLFEFESSCEMLNQY